MIKPIKIDIQKMTLGEQEEYELLSGCTMQETSKKGLSGKRLAALIYVFSKRENPGIKFEDVLKIDLEQAQEMLQGEDPKDKN
jgi:hypothetical protein